jgi:hypothetical protein
MPKHQPQTGVFYRRENLKILIPTGIFLIGYILRFYNLWSIELGGDPALNAMRAVRWFDFLATEGQTSPIMWFGYIPWWGNLSFHDHPSLVFFIQHVFFRLFGDSAFVAILPFCIAGIATMVVLCVLLQKKVSKEAAYIGTLFFAVSSFAISVARSGFLEGIELLFVTLSIVFLVFFLEKKERFYLYLWAVSVGLAILSKYTAIFLIPSALTILAIHRKELFSKKTFIIAFGLLLSVLLPIIIYNVMMFWTRGHFDSVLSSMLGMRPDDFSVVKFRSVDTNIVKNLGTILLSLKESFSMSLLSAFVLGYVALIVQWIRRGLTPLTTTVIAHSVFLVVMFLFGELSSRYLSIGIPILAVVFALLFEYTRIWLRNRFKLLLVAYLFFGTILGGEFLYAVNTHLLKRPLVSPAAAYSHGVRNEGFETLDQFLRAKVYGELPRPQRVKTASDIFHYTINDEVILFDERANWFSRVWYVDRYIHYYRQPLIYFTDLFKMMEGEQTSNIFHFLEQKQVKSIWVVISEKNETKRSDFYKSGLNALEANFYRLGITPVAEIKDGYGEPSFTVYHLVTSE